MFISLGIFNIDVASLWLLFSSVLLAFAFVFGTTAATMFRALAGPTLFVPFVAWNIYGWLTFVAVIAA